MTGFDPAVPQGWPHGHHEESGRERRRDEHEVHGEDTPEHEVHSLRTLFRERRLSIRTMEPRLRLATGAAAASLIGTVLLIALRDVGGADVALGRTGGVVTAMSTPLFIATLVLLSIGLAYVLTGAILASPLIAGIALVVVMAEIGLHTGAFGSVFGFDPLSLFPGWARWSARATLLAITVIAVARDRRRSPPRRAGRASHPAHRVGRVRAAVRLVLRDPEGRVPRHRTSRPVPPVRQHVDARHRRPGDPPAVHRRGRLRRVGRAARRADRGRPQGALRQAARACRGRARTRVDRVRLRAHLPRAVVHR